MTLYEKATGMSRWLLGFVILRELLQLHPDCALAVRDTPRRTGTTPSRADVDYQAWFLSP